MVKKNDSYVTTKLRGQVAALKKQLRLEKTAFTKTLKILRKSERSAWRSAQVNDARRRSLLRTARSVLGGETAMKRLAQEIIDAVRRDPHSNASLEEWYDYVLNWPDIFGQQYIGYWAEGEWSREPVKSANGEEVKVEVEGEWTLRDMEDDGKEYALNRAVLAVAYVYGVFECNDFAWYTDHTNAYVDANTYDTVIQRALFDGEVKYG